MKCLWFLWLNHTVNLIKTELLKQWVSTSESLHQQTPTADSNLATWRTLRKPIFLWTALDLITLPLAAETKQTNELWPNFSPAFDADTSRIWPNTRGRGLDFGKRSFPLLWFFPFLLQAKKNNRARLESEDIGARDCNNQSRLLSAKTGETLSSVAVDETQTSGTNQRSFRV